MKKVIITAVVTALVVAGGIFLGLVNLLGMDSVKLSQLTRLVTTVMYVNDSYVDEVPMEKLVDGAIDGMVNSLGDKHSVYMDSEMYKKLMNQTSGTFGGVGIILGFPEPGRCEVMSAMEDTPSAQAGIQDKDEILKVDGDDVSTMQPEEVANRVRGDVGTQVVLTLRRQGQEDFDVTLTRAVITVPTARGVMLEDSKIGYIRIASFSENTSEEFKTALDELKSQGMEGLIVDLRYNPGGLLTSCVDISNQLIPEGDIVSMVDRKGNKREFTSSLTSRDYPLAVLIDGGSASASEILAGAVQDRQCGTIVGTKSYGKGSVQSMMSLYHGTGLKLTTARYYLPSGRSLDGDGVEPDVVVELPDNPTEDVQLQKAMEVVNEKLNNN